MSYYKPLSVKDNSHIRDKKVYYSGRGNASLMALFSGVSSDISIEEIYGIDYNSSIYQFQTTYSTATVNLSHENLGVIDTSLASIYGLDGVKQSNNQLGLTILSSSVESCASFAFLAGKGAKSYKIRLQMFTPGTVPSLKGFMSLPNQARSFERFQLFDKAINLPENKDTTLDYLVYSLKFLQKRNTVEEPCVNTENYDKVICNVKLNKTSGNYLQAGQHLL
jgi:hypothetical protein